MRLAIRHETTYAFDAPVTHALQRLRLTPQTAGPQRVLDWRVSAQGAAIEARGRDGFGNVTELARVADGPVEAVRFVAAGLVETRPNAGVLGEERGHVPPWLWRRVTPLTRADAAIRALAAETFAGAGRLDGLHALMAAVRAAVRFEVGQTHVGTTAAQALASGQGVCQDHAHVFLAAARTAGVPARYVSGYLHLDGPPDGARPTDAAHAWAEALVEGLGWVGFDAANGQCPDERYVRVAVGLDYRDAAPVTGLRRGTAGETLDVQVTVAQQ